MVDGAPVRGSYLALRMAISFEVVHEDEQFGIRCSRSLATIVWHRSPTAHGIVPGVRALEETFRRRAGRFVLCVTASAGVSLPEGGARRAIERAIRQIEPYLTGAVNILPATGFQGAALRAALTGIALVVRNPYPIAFVSTAREAAAFVTAHWPAEERPAPATADLELALAVAAP
jgi:hypothetical protein